MYLTRSDSSAAGLRQPDNINRQLQRDTGRVRFLLFFTLRLYKQSQEPLVFIIPHKFPRLDIQIQLSFTSAKRKMANPKLSSHARSTSLPSSSHPLVVNAEEHLQRLKSSEGASSSSSRESTCQKLDGLKNLYEYLEDVLQLPHSQRILSNSTGCGEWEEGVLDGFLRILDICGEVREIYSQMKENVQELESSLRRKRSGEFTDEVGTYMNSKKHLNKIIRKCYEELKRAEKKCNLAVADDRSDAYHLMNLIKEIQQLSLFVLDSTLSFISQSKTGSQTKGWSLVSKLIQKKAASCERNSDISGIEKIEVQLHLLKKSGSPVQMQNVLKQIGTVNSSIQESEEVLETVFRQLLKTRVSLLNILNH